MTYLGQGNRRPGLGLTQDELKVLQQVNGGENICVFKGPVTPGGRRRELLRGMHLCFQGPWSFGPWSLVQFYVVTHLFGKINSWTWVLRVFLKFYFNCRPLTVTPFPLSTIENQIGQHWQRHSEALAPHIGETGPWKHRTKNLGI